MGLSYNFLNLKNILSSDYIYVNGWSFLPELITSKIILNVLFEAKKRNIPIIF